MADSMVVLIKISNLYGASENDFSMKVDVECVIFKRFFQKKILLCIFVCNIRYTLEISNYFYKRIYKYKSSGYTSRTVFTENINFR